MLRNTLALVASLALICTTAFGQCTLTSGAPIKVVRYPLSGGEIELLGCYDSGDAINISIVEGSLWSGNWVVQVYDSAAPLPAVPTGSVGAISINGTSTNMQSLALLIAEANQFWSEQDDLLLDAGLLNLNAITIPDPATRAKTRVSVAVSGDIGSIEAGQPHLGQHRVQGQHRPRRGEPERPGRRHRALWKRGLWRGEHPGRGLDRTGLVVGSLRDEGVI